MTAAIEISDLQVAYPPLRPGEPPTPVLQGVNLRVESGEFVALMGRTGAGKTTLCLALNGVVPHSTGGIFRGEVRVYGQDTRRTTPAALAASVGLVFQDAESQFFNMTVEDEVAFGPEGQGLPVPALEERVAWALGVVGMLPYRRRSPFRLSGGQMQRVAIASMLAMQPRVLVLDEPTAGLDPAGKAEVLSVVRSLRAQGITIVMVEQDAEAVAEFADRVIILEDGRVTLEGPPAEILSQPEALARAGLAAPQVSELAARLGHWGGGVPRHIVRLEQACSALAHELGTLTAGQMAPRPMPLPTPARSTAQPILRTADLWYQYNGEIIALRGVDLEIPQGAFVAILGQNGSGKTTLVKHFNGLLKPTRGHVQVCGEHTTGRSVAELARSVGYVFQNPDHQLFCPSVREEVAFGLRNLGLAPAEIEARTDEALERFDLTAHADTPPALLGFGLRRKVTLAAVCAMRPRVLILDEPTTGLDWASSLHLMAYVEELHRAGHTIVLVTHDMRLAATYAERVLVLQEGRVLLDGDTRWVFCQREQLRQAQLEPPQITRLAERLRELGVPLSADILTVDDLLAALPAAALERTSLPRQTESPFR